MTPPGTCWSRQSQVQRPEEAAVVARRHRSFARRSGVVDLDDSLGDASAGRPRAAQAAIRDGVFGVVGDRHDVRARHPDLEPEAVGPAVEHAKPHHVLLMRAALRRVLEPVEQRVERDAWQQNAPAPVRDQTVRRFQGPAVPVRGRQLADGDLSRLHGVSHGGSFTKEVGDEGSRGEMPARG